MKKKIGLAIAAIIAAILVVIFTQGSANAQSNDWWLHSPAQHVKTGWTVTYPSTLEKVTTPTTCGGASYWYLEYGDVGGLHSVSSNRVPIWHVFSESENCSLGDNLYLQADGNLVDKHSENGVVTYIKASGTNGGALPNTIKWQRDGNMVIYNANGTPIWASGTTFGYTSHSMELDPHSIWTYVGYSGGVARKCMNAYLGNDTFQSKTFFTC